MSERKVFTYRDVEEARKWIGKRGVFNDCLSDIEQGLGSHGHLKYVEADEYHFTIDINPKCFQFFSPDPEPVEKWVPFTAEDVDLWAGKMVKRQDSPFNPPGVFMLTGLGENGFELGSRSPDPWTPIELLHKWVFLDGTPCGKKVTK